MFSFLDVAAPGPSSDFGLPGISLGFLALLLLGILLIIIGCIIVIAAVIFIVVRNKKKNDTVATDTLEVNTDSENVTDDIPDQSRS